MREKRSLQKERVSRRPDQKGLAPGQPVPLVARIGPGDVFEFKKIDVVDSPSATERKDIVIAHYAPGKKPQINPGTLMTIRDIAKKRVREANFVVIIGVHLPQDTVEDPFLSELLDLVKRSASEGRCRVDYVNPDPNEIARATSEFGFNGIRSVFGKYTGRTGGRAHQASSNQESPARQRGRKH